VISDQSLHTHYALNYLFFFIFFFTLLILFFHFLSFALFFGFISFSNSCIMLAYLLFQDIILGWLFWTTKIMCSKFSKTKSMPDDRQKRERNLKKNKDRTNSNWQEANLWINNQKFKNYDMNWLLRGSSSLKFLLLAAEVVNNHNKYSFIAIRNFYLMDG